MRQVFNVCGNHGNMYPTCTHAIGLQVVAPSLYIVHRSPYCVTLCGMLWLFCPVLPDRYFPSCSLRAAIWSKTDRPAANIAGQRPALCAVLVLTCQLSSRNNSSSNSNMPTGGDWDWNVLANQPSVMIITGLLP